MFGGGDMPRIEPDMIFDSFGAYFAEIQAFEENNAEIWLDFWAWNFTHSHITGSLLAFCAGLLQIIGELNRIVPMKTALVPIFARISMAVLLSIAMLTSSLAQPEYWKREGWKTDFSKKNIDYSEIMSGGPPRDGIPPIDRPVFVNVADYKELSDRDPVIGLEINGDARAYPLRVLIWHEIVNDVVGGKPVTITYCPLCNAAIVFDATVDGKALDFGTTGKLRNSDLVMYDRATQSWWQQFTGEAIAGEFTGTALKFVPARLESWADFSKRNPEGKVLIPNDPFKRSYGRNPYVNYDISPVPFLYRGAMPKGISAMMKVVVVRGSKGEMPYVVTLEHVRENGPIKHGDVTISWKKGQASALNGAQISESTDVGTVSVVRKTSEGVKIIVYDLTFAFVVNAFHPGIKIIK